ncbi:MAG: hypothetical protein AAGE84_05585 [Cyanobacteria bacterium P01_G01_bin.39]
MNRKKEIQQIFFKSFDSYGKNLLEGEQAYITRIRDSFLNSQDFNKILINHWKYKLNDPSSKRKLEEDIKNQFIHFLNKRKSRLKKIGKEDILAIPIVLFAYAIFSTYVLSEFSIFKKANYLDVLNVCYFCFR